MNGTAFKTDFPDWLSPVCVKELRQGLRGPGFLFVFFLLQACMMVVVMVTLLGQAGPGTNPGGALFWGLMFLAFLLVFPIMAFGAVAREQTENTLELVLMSRLSPRTLFYGKWLSLFAQAVLLTITVLPYMVIRYYAGGIDLVEELVLMFFLLAGSAWIMAVGMGLSVYLGRITRMLLPFFVIGLALLIADAGTVGFLFGTTRSGRAAWELWELWPLFGMAATAALVCLECGASKIAPHAQNHGTLIRSFGLLVPVWLLFCGPGEVLFLGFLGGVLLLLLICSFAMLEPVRPIPGVLVPFVKRGVLGCWVGRWLAPGPHTGLLYTIVVWPLLVVIYLSKAPEGITSDPDFYYFLINLTSLLFFGPAVAVLLQRWIRNSMAIMVGVSVAQLVIGVFLLSMATIRDSLDFTYLAAPLPLANLILMPWLMDFGARARETQLFVHTAVGALVGVAAVLVLLVNALRCYRQHFQLEQRAREELTKLHG